MKIIYSNERGPLQRAHNFCHFLKHLLYLKHSMDVILQSLESGTGQL